MSSSTQKSNGVATPPVSVEGRSGTENGTSTNPPHIKSAPAHGLLVAAKNGIPQLQRDEVRAVRTSREDSPIRSTQTITNGAANNLVRKKSTELSPTRVARTTGTFQGVPSAAAVQRAMSAQRPPTLPTGTDGAVDGTRVDRPSKSGNNSPSWPISPRLRSPPPSMTPIRNTQAPLKKNDSEQTAPNTSLKRLAPVSAPEHGAMMDTKSTEEDAKSASSGLRSPGRGVSASASLLETVEESSIPSTPSIGPVPDPLTDPSIKTAKLESGSDTATKEPIKSANESVQAVKEDKVEPDSKSKPELKHATAPRPVSNNLAKRSLTNLANIKSRPVIEPTHSMTVETETVESVPQIIGGERGLSGRDGNGSVRTKPSSETIRQKKDKKKPIRKPPLLHAGTATSKADIFEAKVANAVDEADTSDSDETFVYESNPPDSRPSRNHSRTPSGASTTGQQDLYSRNKHGIRNASHGVAGKKSMKFTSGAYSTNMDGEQGPSDSLRGNVRNSTPRHHHIGRHGRPGHPSLFDQDSPFSQANKPSSPRPSISNMAKVSRPNSPRISNGKSTGSPRKIDSCFYDIDGDAADDERTPLVGSVRINRSRHSRRPNSGSIRHMEYIESEPRGCLSGWGCCVMVTMLLILLCSGVGTFIVALNRPLMDVSVRHIQNVLASEQELMLDLDVRATNLNLFVITVTDLDVNLFAESAYVGTARDWQQEEIPLSSFMARRGKPGPEKGVISVSSPWDFWPHDGVDEGTDPIDDPESGVQKMLLGCIFEFDSPLVFESSPVRRQSMSSVGEIRLAKPGNKTEVGGSARWERVLQHPFDLIVRGVLKYQLPISSKTRSAKIGSRIRLNDSDAPDNSTSV